MGGRIAGWWTGPSPAAGRPNGRRALVGTLALALGAAACASDRAPSSVDGPTSTTTTATPGATTAVAAVPGRPSPGCATDVDIDGPRPDAALDGPPADLTLEHDGIERTYRVDLPDGYPGPGPAGLIFDLHGFGGTIDQQSALTNLPDEGGARGYLVVTPQGAPLSIPSDAPTADDAGQFDGLNFWNFFGSSGITFGEGGPPSGFEALGTDDLGTDDVGFFGALIDELGADHCIDLDRVFSTGMSNGAGMTTVLGCELGDRIRAVAPVAGVNLTGACPGNDAVAVLAFHGDADTIAGFDGNSLLGFELGNPSVADRMQQWADHDGCAAPLVATDEAGEVTTTEWADCREGATVTLHVLHGWGHAWPSGEGTPGDLDATAMILDFFDGQT